jgi:peptide/nickel transport system permease protein
MPEPSRSAATDQVDVPAPVDDAITPPSEGELDAVVVPDAIEEVELTGGPIAAAPLGPAAPAKQKRRFGVFFWPAEHWFGGDAIGRDLFARVVYGGRVSLTVGVSAIAIGMLIGGSLGLIAGYFRGLADNVITGLANILLAFPPLILALALVSFMGQNLRNVIIALAILSIPSLTRITRAATLTFSQREFVMAARTLGASHWRVITREVLPNVVPPMASFALLAIAVVIVAEGALSFLGLSVEAPTASWGGIINEGRDLLDEAPHISLIPCGVMFLTLLALNYVGDKLQSAWNVREIRL